MSFLSVTVEKTKVTAMRQASRGKYIVLGEESVKVIFRGFCSKLPKHH